VERWAVPKYSAKDLLRIVLLAIAYAALCHSVTGIFTDRSLPILVWPAAGLALSSLILGGTRLWPGIFLGAAIQAATSGLPLWMSLYQIAGKVISAVVGSKLLGSLKRFDRTLSQPSDYLYLVVIGSLCTWFSAFAGASALYLFKKVPLAEMPSIFLQWWQGDTIGVVLVAPALLVWSVPPAGMVSSEQSSKVWSTARWCEAVACFGLTFLAGQVINLDWGHRYLGPFAYNYWLFLFVAWAAVSFGRHGALLVCSMITTQAVYGAIHKIGSFRSDIVDTQLLNLWFFVLALTAVGLMLSLVIHDREVAQAGLAEAKSVAEKANALKGEFLANMSHEIRTPMNAILGLSHLALRTELTPRQQDYLVKIQSSSRTLLTLINDILDFSKIEAGRLDIEHVPFQLNQVIENVSHMLSIKAEEKGLELIFHTTKGTPQGLVGDPLRLGQVLLNLVSNSVKFTETGEVVVTLQHSVSDDNKVRLHGSVRDTGIGMTDEQQNRIFSAFSQADGSTSRKYGGTGLGLSICKQLVTLMGGEIGVKSVAGQGSVFSFNIVVGLDNSWAEREFPLPNDLENMRILVVDDNETARETLEGELSAMKFQVTTVPSGREALSELTRVTQAGEQPYELVLMDWKMPEMDGLETARRIKSDGHVPKVPRIFLVTGDGREEIRVQAETLGLQAFLLKPVNPSILFDHIITAFSTVPLDRASSPAGPAPTAPFSEKMLRGIRILVAEDNAINQQVATEILERVGVVVRIANNGKEAVDMLKAEPEAFDIVLMDMQMPIMSGYEATKVIREELEHKIPIVAVTAHAQESERRKCIEAGMNDHVAKPIEPLDLMATLLRWLPADKLQRSWEEQAEEIAEEPPLESLPELPGVDIAGALRRFSGDQKFLTKMLVEFRQSWSDAIAQLNAQLEKNDRPAAYTTAHTLTGVSATLCMDNVAEASRALENFLRQEDAPQQQLSDLLARLKAALDVVLPGLAAVKLPEKPAVPAAAGPLDKEKIAGLIKELEALLHDHNFEATDAFEKLASEVGQGPWTASMDQVQSALDAFKFGDAHQHLAEVKQALI
jgi:two-component system sensor histidine kinase/response regulator